MFLIISMRTSSAKEEKNTFNHILKQLFLLMIIIVIFFLIKPNELVVADGGCDLSKDFACGSTLDSSAGFGAVAICDDCYVCGVADGVCPEDYTDGTTTASCFNCPDPDCNVTLRGYVKDDYGHYLNDVSVETQIYDSGNSKTTSHYGGIGLNGYYSLNVPPGNYWISFKKFGYQTRLVKFTESVETFSGSDIYELNVTLQNASCHADCSGFYYPGETPRCSAACNGFSQEGDSCTFITNYEGTGDFSGQTFNIAEECDTVPVGAYKTLAVSDNNILRVQCCEGTPEIIPRRKAEVKTSSIKDLIIRSFVSEMQGRAELVKVKIIVFKKN